MAVGGARETGPGPEVPWRHLGPDDRRFSVAEVAASAARFTAPTMRAYGHGTTDVRPAAAMIPVVDLHGEAALVATKRPATMAYHRDDWVFPGGRIEPGEAAADAARREVEEELGVPGDRIDVIAELDTHGPFITGFLLRVFLGVIAEGTPLAPDPREVEEVRVVPVSALLHDDACWRGPIAAGHDPGPTAPSDQALASRTGRADVQYFSMGDGAELWGTQGDIVWDLLARLVSARGAAS